MAGTLGTIRGQISLDVKQAIASYAAVQTANAATVAALRSSGTAFLAAGAVMGGAGLAILAGFGVAIKAAADFEKQLDFFGAVSNSTGAQMDAVRDKALQLGQDTRFSAGQIADSFVELGKAGVSADDIIGGVGEAVASLGAAADIPLDRAAQIVLSAVQTFGLGAGQAVHVADQLAGAANASIVEIEDLGVSLKYVGGIAASISIPIDDTVTALALLGKYGIRGSTAGTSLRQILVSLTGTSDKATTQLKELGIITADGANKFFDAQGKAKPLAEIFQILQDATSGLTEAQRLSTFKTIFNNRALAAAGVLTREGAAGFQTMTTEIGKTTALDVASKRLNNLAGDVEILKGNIETMFIKAGGPFQEFLRGIVQGATQLIQAFANLDDGTQQTILKFLLFAGIGLTVLGAISGIIGIFLRFGQAMLTLFNAINFVVNILKFLIVGIARLGIALLANPVGLIIVAIVALIAIFVLLYQKNEAFRNAIDKIWEALKTGFAAVLVFFQGLPAFFSNLWNTISTGVTSAWNAIGNFFTVTVPGFFTNAWNAVVSGVTGFISTVNSNFQAWVASVGSFFSNLWSSIVAGVTGFISTVASTLSGWVSSIGSFFTNAWSSITTSVSAMVTSVITFFQQLPGQASAIISSFIESVVSFFSQLPYRIGFAIGFLVGTVVNGFITLNNFLVNTASAIVTAVVGFFQQLPGRIATFFTELYNTGVTNFTNIKNFLTTTASAILTAVVGFFQQLPGRISSFFSDMYNRAVAIFSSFQSSASAFGSNVLNAIVNFFQQLPGWISSFFNDMANRARAAFESMRADVTAKASAIVSAVSSFIGQIPERVGSFLSQMRDRASSAFSSALSAASSFGSSVVSSISNFFGQIPGRVGGFLSDMASRASSAFSTVISTASSMASSVVSAISGGLSALPGLVRGILGNVISAFQGVVSSAFNAAKSFASGLWDGFKSGLGINSPSFIEKQMVQITDVIGQETATMHGQVRQVQRLGNRLIQVQTLAPTDQTLTSSVANDFLARMASEQQKLMLLQESIQRSGASANSSINARSLLAASDTPQSSTASSIDALTKAISESKSTQPPIQLDVKVEAPQNMSPDDVGRATASRVGYALSGYTIPIPSPAGR